MVGPGDRPRTEEAACQLADLMDILLKEDPSIARDGADLFSLPPTQQRYMSWTGSRMSRMLRWSVVRVEQLDDRDPERKSPIRPPYREGTGGNEKTQDDGQIPSGADLRGNRV